jgi:hypothetical protein
MSTKAIPVEDAASTRRSRLEYLQDRYDNQSDIELALEADRIRERLAIYSDLFEFRVSDDTRHGGMCRRCKGFVFGSRGDQDQIIREIEAHICRL